MPELENVEQIATLQQEGGDPTSNALKAISATDEELIVGNYIVLFGGRDLEGIASPHKNADGTLGQFFTAQTALESDYTATGTLHVDFEHGWGEAPKFK